ncbi:uncharacterized protein TNCV_1429811 [Trichonephila clavipes]|nr:uncharacterized protein TNCV_1429811 [Trichonephila clavipes]
MAVLLQYQLIDTGKVLDIEVMSSYCPTCKRLQTMPRNFEYESSKADHICQCNFTGSSSKMEIVGASRIFLRSEKNRRLQYTQYYGDGDSKAFMSVKDTYGLNSVTKFECIGHVQKRVGSRLRKLKTKTKRLSGKGKLTDNFIDRLQNYYGIAVRSNVGNLTAMQQNVIAALYHCASSDKKPMHGQCSVEKKAGKESWCYFQRGVANGTKCSTKYAGLSNDVLNKIKPVYLELCDKQILKYGAAVGKAIYPCVPLLTARNKALRLAWARQHRHWTVDDRKHVVWSDESVFQLNRADGRMKTTS